MIHLIPYGIPPGDTRDKMIVQGRTSVDALAAYAANKGIGLAMENGQRRDYDQVLESFLAEFNSAHVGFCYDSGHENVQGRCFHLLKKYRKRLLATHIHDNHGSDTHTLPYEGTIDWNTFPGIFQSIDFPGHLALEVDIKHSQYHDPEVFLSEALNRASKLLQPP